MLPGRVANLRADVWRLAAQPPESEDAFMTTLLGQVGRALLSARAAIYERDGQVFRCTHEWVGGEGRSVPRHEIAREVAAALAPDGQTAEVTPEQVRTLLARAGLEEPVWFQRWVDGPPRLRSALFVPVNHDGTDAWTLVLSQAGDETAPFPPEIRTVVEEIVQIVDLVVARKRAESALRANELRYRTLVESLGEGVGIMDETETFLFANPTGHEIFGVEPGALSGRNLREFLEPGEVERVIEQTALRKQGQRSTYELAIRRPDGSRRIIVATVVPEIDAHGKFAASIGSFFDVTELKRQEEERARIEAAMHHAQKLESLGLLAGGIAHDFNNLLVGVMTNADLALSMAEHSPPVVECLEDILTAARRAAELTSRMLAYAGRGRVNIEPLD
ncbi:MAG TPA: PAS domain S-box protein, partial [Polyangiaceae bacterium]|nr:PAS domain S-box protein [Polyangiaceae bacterium]